MSSNYARPKWWQLYLTFPLLIALFAVNNRLIISTRWHEAMQSGIVLIVFGLIHLWVNANLSALSKMDQRQYHGRVTVIRIPSYQLPDTNKDKRPMFHLPDSEIRGVLSTTFEMDYIDAETFTIDDVPQELNKE